MSRQDAINTLCASLRENPSVCAMWLEGADAHGLEDEYSDIDIWLDVEDGTADDVLDSIRCMLGPLDFDAEGSNPHPQIRQSFLHIRDTSEFMVLDICIQDHSREIAFLNGYADQKAKIMFDKCGVIRYEDEDWQAVRSELTSRAGELKTAFHLGQIGVKKGLSRRNFLEALDYYHAMLGLLVEALRIKHEPTKREFGLKHIARDLPGEIVARLERLYAVSSLEDIEAGYPHAAGMFEETFGGL